MELEYIFGRNCIMEDYVFWLINYCCGVGIRLEQEEGRMVFLRKSYGSLWWKKYGEGEILFFGFQREIVQIGFIKLELYS